MQPQTQLHMQRPTQLCITLLLVLSLLLHPISLPTLQNIPCPLRPCVLPPRSSSGLPFHLLLLQLQQQLLLGVLLLCEAWGGGVQKVKQFG